MARLGSVLYYRQSTSIFLSDLSIVFPLETSIFLERLPLERERYKKKIVWRKIALALTDIFSGLSGPFDRHISTSMT